MYHTLWMKNQRYNDSLVVYLIILRIVLSMAIQKLWKKLCKKPTSVMNRIRRRKAWPTGRPKRIKTIMIKRRNNLCPTGILKTIRPENFLTKTSKGIRIMHQVIRIIQRVKNLLIAMAITPSTLSAKNL